MRPLIPALRGTAAETRSRRRRLAWSALAFLLLSAPPMVSALDRAAQLAAAPEPGRAEAFAVRMDGNTLMWASMWDLARIERLHHSLAGDFLWLRQGGLEYVLQDPALLDIGAIWSQGSAPLLGEENELAEGRGARLAEQEGGLESRREEVRREQDRVAREESRLSDEESTLHWREHDLNAELLAADSELLACRLREEIEATARLRVELDIRQEETARESAALARRMAGLDLEARALRSEADAIARVQSEIDGRQDELFRTLDATLLRLLERAITAGTAAAPSSRGDGLDAACSPPLCRIVLRGLHALPNPPLGTTLGF